MDKKTHRSLDAAQRNPGSSNRKPRIPLRCIQATRVITCCGFLLFSSVAFGFTWQDLWQRPDQQGEAALQAGKPAQAAELFSSPEWQAVANYRAGQYQNAYKLFSQDNSAQGFYNRGNALAHMGKYKEAINAYDQALKKQIELTDAKYNKDLLEKLLQQDEQQQNKQQNKDQQQDDQQQNDKDQQQNDQQRQGDQNQQQGDQQQNGKDQQQNNRQQNNQDQQQDDQQQQKNQDQQQNDQQQNGKDQKQNKQPSSSQSKSKQSDQNTLASNTGSQTGQPDEQQEATEQWLQNIPDDPGGLLKQKFLRDHNSYQQQRQQGQAPW